MFNNALKHISTGLSKVSSKLSSTTQKIVELFPRKVEKIISHQNPAANDDYINTQDTEVKDDNNSIKQDFNTDQKVLSDFSGQKILTLNGQKIKLVFQEGKIKKAIKNVNGNDIHLNAKAIRKISQLLQKKSTEVNKVSYRTKRNVQKSIEPSLNVKLHGQYTYTNDYKTSFTVLINKWKIIKAHYLNTKISASSEEILIIQDSINKNSEWLSNHKNARQLKKEMKKSSSTKKNTTKEKINLQGTRKHNDALLAKQKREKIETERKEKEQYRIEKESHMEQDYKTLFRYQTALSKCNTQWDIINWSENIAEVVLKTFAARKGINWANFQAFLHSSKTFEIFKRVIKNYLTIDASFSSNGQLNRNSLFNIFMNASEIYSKHLYIKTKHTSKKKKSGPNIFDADSENKTDDLKQQKKDWVNKYYPNKEAA